MLTVGFLPRCAAAADFFSRHLARFAEANATVREMANRFREHAGVAIGSLVDHWALEHDVETAAELAACGLVEESTNDGDSVWRHPLGRLPRVRLVPGVGSPRMVLAVEDIGRFTEANDLPCVGRHGDTDSGYECALFPLAHGTLGAAVRMGYAGFRPGELSAISHRAIRSVRARLRERSRARGDREALEAAIGLVNEMAGEIGMERTADEFFSAERDFYATRCAAARWQYARQQEIGIGWANHDHHTYRSSRAQFQSLMEFFATMGFVFRERYYSGADAGWGAQILEHPVSRVVIFADVDIAPDELNIDFANDPLAPRDTLGTIGLWCALHGTSIGQAGMHHLECEFDFAQAEANLTAAGFGVMRPFTDLPILKQAFTVAEPWKVEAAQMEPLLANGAIGQAQADRFAAVGAPGSHLELLQRWEGFKGFNKTGVSQIIRETDARCAD